MFILLGAYVTLNQVQKLMETKPDVQDDPYLPSDSVDVLTTTHDAPNA